MSGKKKQNKKKLVRVLLEYGLHLWLILFIANVAIVYALHFFLIASTCMTPTQVSSDNRCLYIWGHQVFQKGSRGSPHQGHQCGTDVTSIIPASHIGNQASYMLPNYVADICSSNPAPTPTPKPTSTPIPTPTPTQKPIPTIIPTSKPLPTIVPTAKPIATVAQIQPTPTPRIIPTTIPGTTVIPTITPRPTALIAQATSAPTTITQPVNTSVPIATQIPIPANTVSPSQGVIPANTPLPNPTSLPVGPVINLSFSIPGIGSDGGNLAPLHPTRNLTIYLYNPGFNSSDHNVQPNYIINSQATYDADPNSPTYTDFVNNAIDLGSQVRNGQYQIVFKADQTLRTLIKENATDIGGKVFTVTQGQTLNTPIPHQTTIVGDIFPQPNGDNTMDINDYNFLTDCFGDKADTPSCPNKQAADLDDNGVIDGLDYNLMLLSFKQLLALGFSAPTLVIASTPTPTFAPIPTSIPLPTAIQIAIKTALISPTPTAKVFITMPVKKIIAPSPEKKATPDFKQLVLVAGTTGIFLSKALVIVGFLLLLAIVTFAVYKSKSFYRLFHKETEDTHHAPSHVAPTTQPPAAVVPSVPTDPSLVDGDYFIKKKSENDTGVWVTLTGDTGSTLGFYPGKEITEGFARIKGKIKQNANGQYVSISEILPSE